MGIKMAVYVYRDGRMVNKKTGEPMNPAPHAGPGFPCPRVVSDIEPYVSPATGKHITTRPESKADLAASGCIDSRDLPKRETAGKLTNRRFAKKRGLEHMLA